MESKAEYHLDSTDGVTDPGTYSSSFDILLPSHNLVQYKPYVVLIIQQ